MIVFWRKQVQSHKMTLTVTDVVTKYAYVVLRLLLTWPCDSDVKFWCLMDTRIRIR